jgi:hypothetical protein
MKNGWHAWWSVCWASSGLSAQTLPAGRPLNVVSVGEKVRREKPLDFSG